MRSLLIIAIGAGLLSTGCTQFAVTNHFVKRTTAQDAPYQAPPIREKRKIGNPYTINGIRYYPMSSSEGYREKGIASWYGKDFHGKKTANGERYNMYAISAAHKTLPLPTWVRVTNLENGRSLVIRVNDRGPFVKSRIIDLSYGAAQALDMAEAGLAPVLVEALPTDGSPLRVQPETRVVSTQKPQQQSFTQRVSAARAEQPVPSPQVQSEPITEQTVQKPVTTQRHPLVEPQVHAFSSVEIFVQVGAFGDPANADRQLSKVKTYYPNSFTQKVVSGGRELERVRVGPFQSVEAADTALARLVEAGFNTAVIAIENK